MQGAMLPLMSTTNTISATPLVFARACGAGAEAAGAATPCDASASAGWIGAVAGAVGESTASGVRSTGRDDPGEDVSLPLGDVPSGRSVLLMFHSTGWTGSLTTS